MHCDVCGLGDLIETEYTTGEVTAPALQCRHCHAIHLHECVAKSEHDMDSVRRALAARRASTTPLDAPMLPAPSGSIAVDLVEAAVREINVLVAQLRVSLGILADATAGETATHAAADLRGVVDKIAYIVDDLGQRCARATPREIAASDPPKTGAA